jgi:hypothetical protein
VRMAVFTRPLPGPCRISPCRPSVASGLRR